MITLIKSIAVQTTKPLLHGVSSDSAPKDNSFLKTLSEISKKDLSLQKNNVLLLNLLASRDVKQTGTSKLSPNDKQNNKNSINEQILALLDSSSLKLIIKSAKQNLTNTIKNSPLVTAKDIKQMPKTIKGLLQLAKTLKIDISKITLKNIINIKPLQTLKITTLKTTTANLTKSASQLVPKIPIKEAIVNNTTKLPTKLQKVMQTSLANAPLFQAVKKNIELPHLTKNIINSKINEKPTTKKTETSILATLLNKDISPTHTEPKLNLQPIVVAQHISSKKDTLKLDAQNNMQPSQQNIQLDNPLNVNTQNQAFTVKVHEAKQMVKYLAQNIKQTIDNYRPPFTKISLKLNPKKLGEIDLTVIQRGKNLHVNIASNNNAINILAQNSNDLKIQLSQNGMNNASLNFSNSGNMSDSSHKQHQEDAKKTYRQFDEQNEDFANSLEIIIPRYI